MVNLSKSFKMHGQRDCGPSALSFATGLDYDQIVKAWGWPTSDDWKCDARDNPGAHFRVLNALKIPWQITDCGKILAGQATENKTIILLAANDDPKTLIPEDYQYRHWVVLAGIQDGKVIVHWGDGQFRTFSRDPFIKAYSGGSPACAYEVGKGSGKGQILARIWDWLISKVV
ncbi:MAG: hypothetical protein HQM08_17300 [Candidatus Riflebacteria bacterium]|nr:hypothetical protein [Candidatus Riflebacteria bacterium]